MRCLNKERLLLLGLSWEKSIEGELKRGGQEDGLGNQDLMEECYFELGEKRKRFFGFIYVFVLLFMMYVWLKE